MKERKKEKKKILFRSLLFQFDGDEKKMIKLERKYMRVKEGL